MEAVTHPREEQPSGNKGKNADRATLYRVTMQNQLRTIGIADQKGNIIIGINTILISIVIAILGMESSMEKLNFIGALNLNIPLLIMVGFGSVSGTIALFAVRPISRPWRMSHGSKLFFRDYKGISLEEFQRDMEEILRKPENIYRSLNTDIYLFGQAIQRKYQLLRLSYYLFLAGLLLSVCSFFLLKLI